MIELIAAGSLIVGIVTHVRDADTIEVNRQPIRLEGIAAPELGEQRGREGKIWLKRLIERERVRCRDTGDRSHDRIVATCTFEGRDLGEIIVEAGFARDCRRYSHGEYRQFETTQSRRLPLPRYCR